MPKRPLISDAYLLHVANSAGEIILTVPLKDYDLTNNYDAVDIIDEVHTAIHFDLQK